MLTLLFAVGLAFPVPASRPIPVTAPVLGLSPGEQRNLHVASNGAMDFAVWNDERSGYDVIGTRVSSEGMPLDPTGIVVQPGAFVQDVLWTGSSFAVVTALIPPPQIGIAAMASLPSSGYVVTYVGEDGTVTAAKPLAPADSLSYAARSGDGPDVRFLFLPPDGFARFARVVDLQGRVIRQGTSDRPYAYAKALAASNGSTFLVLRENQGTFVAETLDLDGGWGGSSDPHLPQMFSPQALSPDGHGGYALIGYDPIKNVFAVVRLDANGVSAGPPQETQSYGADTVYDAVNDLRFTAHNDEKTLTLTDVFVQKGSAPPVPLTRSANFQTNAAIAAGASGFLAAWTENSGTGISIYVRRFASDATPLGEAQVADTTPYGLQTASVTSSGDTYLLSWDRKFARRFDARNARWLDAVAFPLNAMAVASNGSSVLALTCEAKCPDFPCTMARRVAMSGSAAVSAGTMLWGWDSKTRAALASDGTNYLAVWNDRLFPSPHLVAMRLRADGTPIDAAPLVLGVKGASEAIPSVAWNGKTYLVAWSDDFGTLSAAYVGSDGALRQLGDIGKCPYGGSLKVAAHDGTFVIFSEQSPSVVNATLLDGSTTTLDVSELDAASDGTRLMLAYARVDAQAGRVSRVFLDPRVLVTRKRAVH